jgi:adenylate kinase family enzyme
MSIYLDPEIEEGNIEYKRCLSDTDITRLEEYTSQMLWRIGEGKGEAIYYLGVEDNGTFYNWNEIQKNKTLQTFKKIVNKADLKIAKLEKINYKIESKMNYYYKVVIREKQKNVMEKRILLLGESGIGKSTFIANIILSKVDELNKEARMYLFNHKHEIIQKKTSSFNYMYIIYNNIKWVFIEVPGTDKFIKTRNKIILSFGSTINCCLFLENDKEWSKKSYYSKYFNEMNIPCLNLNLYSMEHKFPNYNGKLFIDKNEFFSNIESLCKEIPFNKKTEFIVLQSFKNYEPSTTILTGILKGGKLIINKDYFLTIDNVISEIKINSIHVDGIPTNKIIAPSTISVSISSENIDFKNIIGIISEEPLNKIKDYIIEYDSVMQTNLVYKDNKILKLKDLKNSYQTIDKIFLVDNGIGVIVEDV